MFETERAGEKSEFIHATHDGESCEASFATGGDDRSKLFNEERNHRDREEACTIAGTSWEGFINWY